VNDELRKSNRITHRLGLVVAALTAFFMLLVGLGLLSIASTNKRGVERIVSCTTPGRMCYEDEKARNAVSVVDPLLKLNQEYRVIECLLKLQPTPSIRAANEERCRSMAAVETEKYRQELEQRSRQARSSSETRTTKP
jgi:hypothetical protein